jgi:hypothetical protein
MSEPETGAATQDLMEKMRELRDAYLETWSKHLVETVNSDSYAEASGALLNNYLNVSAPFKEPAEKAMLRTLEQFHMPTSADFAGLAGRFTNIEMQLDNLDAKLDRIEKLLGGVPVAPVKQASSKPAEARASAVVPRAARKPIQKKATAAKALRSKAKTRKK